MQIFPPQTPLSSEGKERAFESLRGKDGNFTGRVKGEQIEFEDMRQEQIDLLIIPKYIHPSLKRSNISSLQNNPYEHQYHYRVAARLKDDVYPFVSSTFTCLILLALILLGWHQTYPSSNTSWPEENPPTNSTG